MIDLTVYSPGALTLLGMCVIVFFAAIVQASLGMGYGLVAAPLLALLDPVFVPVATIIIGMISSSIGAFGEYNQIVWREVAVAAIGRLVGSAIAVFLIATIVDKNGFLILFGCVVGVAVCLSILGYSLRKTTGSLLTMGSVSGLMGTITGVGAPPLALVYQGSYAGQARPTLAAIFAVGCGFSLLMLMMIGWVGWQEITLAGLMLPPMFLGTVAGRKLLSGVANQYRRALLILSAVAATALVVEGMVGVV